MLQQLTGDADRHVELRMVLFRMTISTKQQTVFQLGSQYSGMSLTGKRFVKQPGPVFMFHIFVRMVKLQRRQILSVSALLATTTFGLHSGILEHRALIATTDAKLGNTMRNSASVATRLTPVRELGGIIGAAGYAQIRLCSVNLDVDGFQIVEIKPALYRSVPDTKTPTDLTKR